MFKANKILLKYTKNETPVQNNNKYTKITSVILVSLPFTLNKYFHPVGIYLLKVNNRSIRTIEQIVSIVNFEHVIADWESLLTDFNNTPQTLNMCCRLWRHYLGPSQTSMTELFEKLRTTFSR